MIYVVVFFAYLAVDVAYAAYIVSAANGRAIAASNWSVAVYVFSAIGLASFVEDKWAIIPMVAGGWLGSFIVITINNKRKK